MKVAVGLSGGVDSSVAALLLRRAGHEVVGVTMTLGRADEAESLAEARAVADRLGIPFHVFDFASEWKRCVCDYVRTTYLAGATPNPCVQCNEFVKFGLLPRAAFALGCDRFATGHYARILDGRLWRGVDHAKDQSYFLYRVDPGILARTLLPLGELTKQEVRQIASSAGFASAGKGDSQDFCGGDPLAIVGEAPREGNVVLRSGRVIGRHHGFWRYTVGKRKGLGIGGGVPFYVIGLRPETNEVVVGPRDEAISYDFDVVRPVGTIDKKLPVKVRSAGEPRLLHEGIPGVAPGQSAVFYEGDRVVGGGIISSRSCSPLPNML